MKISFEHQENAGVYENILKTKTSDGLPIEIYFAQADAAVITLGGSDYEVNEDGYQGLYVSFGSLFDPKIIPVSEVIRQANSAIEDIIRDHAVERQNWDRHTRSCAQPSL